MKKKDIDIKIALMHFFDMPKWKVISAILGGTMIVIMMIGYPSAIMMEGDGVWVALGIFGYVLYMVLMIIFQLYMVGYSLDIVKNTTAKGPYLDASATDNMVARLKDGLFISVANFVYMLPAVVMYLVMAVAIFFPLMNGDDFDTLAGVSIGVGIFSAFILFAYVLIAGMFWSPALIINYAKKGKFSALFELSAIWKIVRANTVNLLVVYGIYILSAFIFMIAYMIAAMSIFLCVGIVLLPIVIAVGTTWMIHVYANLLGQVKVLDAS